MRAAFFEKDVTPPVGTWLNGFGARNAPSDGVDDPIFIRILGLEDDKAEKALIITADVLWFHRDMSFRIKYLAEKGFGVKSASVLLNASHTHCGPLLAQNPVYPHWPVNWQYVDHFERTILEGVESVVKNLHPARIRFGLMQSHFGINRRLPIAAGKVDESIRPNEAGYYDPDLPVMAVYDAGSSALEGIFYSYACHPSEKGGGHFSANFPGAVSRGLKKIFGEGICTPFAQGAGGDIKPRFYDGEQKRFLPASLDDVERLGAKIAAEIADGMNSGQVREMALDIRSDEREFTIPYDLTLMYSLEDLYALATTCATGGEAKIKAKLKIFSGLPSMTKAWATKLIEDIRTGRIEKESWMHATRIRLNDRLHIIGMSGETVSELGRMVKDLYPGMTTIFLGYCSYVGSYVPISRMLSEGGYESVRSCSEYMMTAPFVPEIDAIIKRAIASLK